MTLEEFFKTAPRAAAAFSGGVDSAFLLWAAVRYGCDVHAYYVKTAFQPEFELEDARRLARQLHVPLTVIEKDILSVPEAAANGPDRCYHCKRARPPTGLTGAITASGRFLPACGKRRAATGIRFCWTERMHPMTPATVRECGR